MKKIYPVDIKELIFHSTHNVKADYEVFFNRKLTDSEFDEISELLISTNPNDNKTSFDSLEIIKLKTLLSEKLGGTFIDLDD